MQTMHYALPCFQVVFVCLLPMGGSIIVLPSRQVTGGGTEGPGLR